MNPFTWKEYYLNPTFEPQTSATLKSLKIVYLEYSRDYFNQLLNVSLIKILFGKY